jgi:hypothetical protein
MKLGISLPASVNNQHRLGAGIDALPFRPDAVAIWSRGFALDSHALGFLRQRGLWPVIFVEADGIPADRFLDGSLDERIDALAKFIPMGSIVRLLQEPNSKGLGATWCEWPPETYIAVFRYLSERIRAIRPSVRIAYCPVWRGPNNASDFKRWWPGDDAAQIVAFDTYARRPAQRIPNIWHAARGTFRRFTKAPIWVMEFGIARGVRGRGRWLRDLRYVRGIEGAIYFDIDLASIGELGDRQGHAWSMGPAMKRTYGRLLREL